MAAELASTSLPPISPTVARLHCDPLLEACWPILDSADFDPPPGKTVANQRRVLQLLTLFDREEQRERELVMKLLHRVYSRLFDLRGFIRKEITNILLSFIYETQRFNGIGELLRMLATIIDGFALPLKAEHKQFFVKVLIPLHKPKLECLALYHTQLMRCVMKFLAKDATLTEQVVKGLLKIWPRTCQDKEWLFLGEIEDILGSMEPTEFAKIGDMLFKQIAKCVCSPNSDVVIRALWFWDNDYILSLIKLNNQVVMPLMFPALYRTSKEHWNKDILPSVYKVLRSFIEHDVKLFDKLACSYETELQREKKRAEERDELWKRLFQLELHHKSRLEGNAVAHHLLGRGRSAVLPF